MSARALRHNVKTAVIAVIVTAIVVTLVSGFTAGTPEVITQLIFGVGGAVISGLVTVGVLLVPRIRGLRVEQQRKIIWLTSSCSGLTFLLTSWFVFSHSRSVK